MNDKWLNKLAVAAFTILLGCFALFFGQAALADQDSFGASGAANATRACSFDSIVAQVVAVTASSAPTTNPTGKGQVRIVCTQNAHVFQGAFGVTTPVALATSTYLPAGVPEYVWSTGGKFAFIRDSADGSCYVTDCK